MISALWSLSIAFTNKKHFDVCMRLVAYRNVCILVAAAAVLFRRNQ